ncbi:MAG: hypothetical protein MZV64_29660 [Ignavibacteriales bacterium]|nr:hypothetical protein [Ignavibacteriales bacterium]
MTPAQGSAIHAYLRRGGAVILFRGAHWILSPTEATSLTRSASRGGIRGMLRPVPGSARSHAGLHRQLRALTSTTLFSRVFLPPNGRCGGRSPRVALSLQDGGPPERSSREMQSSP